MPTDEQMKTAQEAAAAVYWNGDDHLHWLARDDGEEEIREGMHGVVIFSGDADECYDFMHRARLDAAVSAAIAAYEGVQRSTNRSDSAPSMAENAVDIALSSDRTLALAAFAREVIERPLPSVVQEAAKRHGLIVDGYVGSPGLYTLADWLKAHPHASKIAGSLDKIDRSLQSSAKP